MKLKLVVIILICIGCNKEITKYKSINGTYTSIVDHVPFRDESYLRFKSDSIFIYGQTIQGTQFSVSGVYILIGENIILNTLREETYFAVPDVPDDFYQKIDTAKIFNSKKILFKGKTFKINNSTNL